jgi:hypothetical protein
MNEVAGLTVSDISGNNRNGTIVEGYGTYAWEAGKLNNCLSLVGNYVNLHDIANFERTDSFSFELWYKFTSTVNPGCIFGKTDTALVYRGYMLRIEAGKIALALVNTLNTNNLKKRTQSAYNDGNWHHIIVTYNGSSLVSGIIIYIDGSPATCDDVYDNLSNTIVVTAKDLLMSNRTGLGTSANGSYDEVLLYTKCLCQDEVTARYNAGTGTEVLDFTQSCNETLGTIDTVSRQVDFIREFDESLGLSDTYSRQIDYIRLYSETLGLSDSFSRIVEFSRLMAEGLSLSDSKIIDFYKSLSENLGLSDNFSRIISFYRLLTETISISDQRSYSINKKLTELLSLLDSLSRQVDYKRTLPEGIILTDVEKEAFSKSLKETMTLTSSLKKELNKLLKSTLHLVDVYSRIVAYKRTFTETLHLVDNRRLLFYKPLEEALFLYGDMTNIKFGKKFLETLHLISTRNISDIKVLLETMNLTDVLTKRMTFIKQLLENLNFLSSISKQYNKNMREEFNLARLLYEHHNDDSGNDPNSGKLDEINWKAQTFTTSEAHRLKTVKLKLRREIRSGIFGTQGPGTLTVSVRRCNPEGQPSGNPDLTIGTLDASLITTNSSGAWYEIALGTNILLLNGIKYGIVARNSNDPLKDYIYWFNNVPGTYVGGSAYTSPYDTYWSTIIPNTDFTFENIGGEEKLFLNTNKKLQEDMNLSDQVQRSIAFIRLLTEELSLSSQQELNTYKNLLETIMFSDGINKDLAKVILESIILTGTEKKSFSRSLYEHMFVIEDFSKSMNKLLKENMTLTDTINVMAYFILYVIGDILLGYPKMSRSIIKLTYSKLQRHTMLLARRIQRITAKLLKRRRIKSV